MSDQTQEHPDDASSAARAGATSVDHTSETGSLRVRVVPEELLAPGTVIGRFIVHRALGAGGAAVVYAAHDPELDRTIALKILRREVAERADARTRFLREAQALARLSHPNVISVYDVGAAGGHTFIAMEYIDGQTFADWLTTSPRSWSQIVAVLIKAGRGLSAAHAAGLIHRDFKPANLLVGDDGRVVVTDFGLARVVETTSDPLPGLRAGDSHGQGVPRCALSATITRMGAVQGTPAYMAPEQQDGRVADARADQFSFCVTLHEALFGVHPFLLDPPPSLSSDARAVPVWLQRATQRGLSERPEDRYPSMDGLLTALIHEPMRRRRWVQAAAGGAALVGAAILVYALASRPTVSMCAGGPDRLAGIWNWSTRAEISWRFAAMRLPYAPDAWRRVEPILDAYAAQWSAMHTDACEATRVHGEQSELMMDRRMACLDVRRRELDQLIVLLRAPDADIVEHAVQAAHGLSAIQGCGDLAALTRPIAAPPDPVTAARVSELRQQLAEVRVLHDTGKYADGLALIAKIATAPVAQDYLPLRAEVAQAAGRLYTATTEWELALARLQDSIWAAEASGHDGIAVAALSGAVWVLADLDRFKETDDIIRRGEAALLRAASAPLQRAAFRASVCHALDREGRFADARTQCQQVLDLRRRELAPDHPDIATALYYLGAQANRFAVSDSFEQALGYFREALAIQEKALGPEHPEVPRTLTALGDAEMRLGRLDDALAHDRRALEIAERVLEPDSMRMFGVLSRLGDVLRRLGRNAEAGDVFRRALALAERAVGPAHSQTAIAHLHVGDVLQAQTEYAAALQHYQRAESILAASVGTAHANYAIVLLDICSMELELKRARHALPGCTRGLAVLEDALGRDAPAVADALVGLIDRVFASNGMMREALAALERGIAIWRKDDPTADAKIAEGELTLAQTIWERAPAERARARSLATRAHERLRRAEDVTQRTAVASWLSTHR